MKGKGKAGPPFGKEEYTGKITNRTESVVPYEKLTEKGYQSI